MNLFRVTLLTAGSRYVLAEDFNSAASTVISSTTALTPDDVMNIENLGRPMQWSEPVAEPAVPIKKSVTPDWIVCLDDGKKFKSLRRHLSVLGMTPAEYRAKWGLPKDYPMVAAAYSAKRSELAKANGLGRA